MWDSADSSAFAPPYPLVKRALDGGAWGWEQETLVAASNCHRADDGGQVGLRCPDCGLYVSVRAAWLSPRFCPRCAARAQIRVEMEPGDRAAPRRGVPA